MDENDFDALMEDIKTEHEIMISVGEFVRENDFGQYIIDDSKYGLVPIFVWDMQDGKHVYIWKVINPESLPSPADMVYNMWKECLILEHDLGIIFTMMHEREELNDSQDRW